MRAIALALLLDDGRVDDVAERSRRRAARVCNGLLEPFGRQCAKRARLLGQILVDALHGQRRPLVWRGIQHPARELPARATIQADRFLLRLAELIDAARSAHPYLDRVSFKILVLGLPRIGGHGDSLVADVLDFIDGARLGQRLAGRVVADQRAHCRATLKLDFARVGHLSPRVGLGRRSRQGGISRSR